MNYHSHPFRFSSLIKAAIMVIVSLIAACSGEGPYIEKSSYKGWPSTCFGNELVRLQIVPEIGGRVMQYSFDGKDFMFVNPLLAGKYPPAGGVGPGNSWLNYGADKLWLAPQGSENDEQWAGPPDGILDGGPYKMETISSGKKEAAIRLTSGEDTIHGVTLSRIITLYKGTTHVSFQATMKNIDKKPRRWGIWSHTQLDGGRTDGKGYNTDMYAWCPVNRLSHFPKGYNLMFGDENNPTFRPDTTCGLMRVKYLYKVGKIGMDSPDGWIATVDGTNGKVFVQRFTFEQGKEYPDGASVEFWMNGVGRYYALNQEKVMPDDPVNNPYVFESEMVSPFAKLSPGESYTWGYEWYASNIGGNFKITNCTPVGITADSVKAEAAGENLKITGRFGVFAPGTLILRLNNSSGNILKEEKMSGKVSPLKPVIMEMTMKLPAGASSVTLSFCDAEGNEIGILANAIII